MTVVSHPALHVLIADADPFVTAVAARALREVAVVTEAPDGEVARTQALADPEPQVLLVDWALWGADARAICSELHTTRRVHVIAMIASGRPADVSAAIEDGADECMTKPLSMQELLARVSWAERMFTALPPPSAGLRAALAQASRGGSGEVVVSAGGTVGRIFFDGGEIAWAVSSDRLLSLSTILGTSLPPVEASEATKEARRTERNVFEILVEWGLASRADVVAGTRRYLRETVRALFLLHDPQVVYAPAQRSGGWSGPRFAVADIVPPETRREMRALRILSPVPPAPERCQFAPDCGACERVGAMLDLELRESGADGIAIVHGPTAETLAHAGAPIDQDVVRAQVQMVGVLAADHVDDVVVTTTTKQYLIASTACPDAFIVLTAERKKVALGALKHDLARLAAKLYPDEATTSRRDERSRSRLVPRSRSSAPPTKKSEDGT